MSSEMSLNNISPIRARRFLKTLSDGIPPRDTLTSWLTVGQEELLSQFEEDLKAITDGQFRSLLILGNTGAGKSQLLITLQYSAMSKGFVTAYFSQDLQSKLAFNRPDQIYRRIIETMRFPEATNNAFNSLRQLLDAWVDKSLPKLRWTRRSMAIAHRLSEVGLLPEDVLNIHPRTRVALVGYIMASERQDEDAKLQFLNVLSGASISSSELMRIARSIELERRGFIGYTPNVYDTNYYFGQLRSIIFILRSVGYQGLVVLFDEVTAVIDLALIRSRGKAYKVLDSLFFNDHAYHNFYSVFAYMPAFINQLRMDQARLGEGFLKKWEIIFRERTKEIIPLNTEHMRQLFERIIQLYCVCYSGAVGKNTVDEGYKLVARCQQDGLTTRDFVRMTLNMLNDTFNT